MRPRVAELMPPVLSNDFTFVDLINGPEMSIAVFVQINRLEDMSIKRHLRRELSLIVRAVEAHFQFCAVLRVRLSEVHGLERLLRKLDAGGLVDAGESRDGLLAVVKVLVVLLHIF